MNDGLIAVSVVIASHHRAPWLLRCLNALFRVRHPRFEVIVVADGPTLATIDESRFAGFVKTARFDHAALAAARNIGLGLAAGDVCAFIDDDAVPEPMWLTHLSEPFETLKADAVVGFVRGRNGISFQSRVSVVDKEAETHQVDWSDTAPAIVDTEPGSALKLVGTNMAVRTDMLRSLGGFDTDFNFYLDDSDVSLRLSRAGARMAAAPLAEVHHAFASSSRRTAQRRPRQLFDIGRSTAAFVRKHGVSDPEDIRLRLVRRERARMVKHLVRGTCEPRDVTRLLRDLQNGWQTGLKLPTEKSGGTETEVTRFLAVPHAPDTHHLLSSRLLRRRHMAKRAVALAESGATVSFFSFSLSPIRHHVRFARGVWHQTGGQFGRTDREDVVFRWTTFAKRLRREVDRVAKPRGIVEIGKVRETND